VTTFDRYPGPSHPGKITTDDVHQALAFLIAIEPHEADDIDSDEDYEAAPEAFRDEADVATLTLRRFAEQAQPQSLEEMQASYYRFTNDPRYLETVAMSAVVTSALTQAWDGVGPWRQ
jgi:hypothetical protein